MNYIKSFLILIITSTSLSISNAQNTKTIIPEFKNQGEQEDYWAKQAFENGYKKQSYKKHKGPIVKEGNTYKYGEIQITIDTSVIIKKIIESGIFYSDILAQSAKYQFDFKKIEIIKDTSKITNDPKPRMMNPNILLISFFKELNFWKNKPKIRRFRFWLTTKGLLNPTEYYMELTNNKATSKTSTLDFIDNAKLTFFKQGGIII